MEGLAITVIFSLLASGQNGRNKSEGLSHSQSIEAIKVAIVTSRILDRDLKGQGES